MRDFSNVVAGNRPQQLLTPSLLARGGGLGSPHARHLLMKLEMRTQFLGLLGMSSQTFIDGREPVFDVFKASG